ncbi:histidinol-phosphatase [Pleomorphomonas diazotrophica]|uniref:Histidinol-phosphatase n=1 Tax=Pleomorphomonas diazotrophica TaxID=1166257 RepID=A0A1I4VS69_9HYPH|nr:histidinol-phosphatase [Pleomorphomonas diazotrophica]PKR89342.1 histidinol-phosphatase [Pleomorphomonas diazotrophica]SFN03937.1 myo-inositol-1(or 4)-monophosphatase [Pleomorphomonas diazotrophica]
MQITPISKAFFDQLADAASAAILPHFRTALAVENKLEDAFDPVTVADRAGEVAMRELIGATYPDHGILGEEFGNTGLDRDKVWVLDPVDGTRSFIAGIPLWGTLIGLRASGRAVQGMMAQPFTGERFYGDGVTASYTGPGGERLLRTRPCSDISQATLFTTSLRPFSDSERQAYLSVEGQAKLVRYSADCYAYCMVAAGQADLVIEAGLQPYDITALIPVIEGAGGVVTNWTGGSAADGGRVVASGDRRLHDQVLKLLAAGETASAGASGVIPTSRG